MLFVGLAAGAYSSIFLATPIVADLKEREPEQIALRRRVHGPPRRPRCAGPGTAVPAGPVASARRARPGSRSAVAVAERDLPGQVAADVVVESPSSVRPEPGTAGDGDAAARRAAAAARPRRAGRGQEAPVTGARPSRRSSRSTS